MTRRSYLRGIAIALTVLVVPAVLLMMALWSRDAALAEMEARTRGLLNLYAANADGYLGKFATLPRLLAESSQVRDSLDSPQDEETRLHTNVHLERFTDISGALTSYVMTAGGLTIAASNWAAPDSFVGHNFAFRPYFQDAMQGRSGRYFALGTTSLQRGYYFSHPVVTADGVAGVAVVKTDLKGIEQSWSGAEDIILVTDPDGVVFISTMPGWLFRTLTPLPEDVRARLADSRRYPGASFAPLPFETRQPLDDGMLVRLRQPLADGERTRGEAPLADYMMLSRAMPRAGWTMHVLTDAGAVSSFILKNVIFAGLGLALLGVTLVAVVQRMGWYRARIALEQETSRILSVKEEALRRAHDELEQRVRDRTADLRHANERLRAEIQERERARDELRRAQDEVVHAGKLAAIGQLAAGITHELNQPLAAMRAYADNARIFLSRERYDDVAGNLHRISGLTERMADISSHLKRFARKARGEIGPVPLAAVVAQSLDLMSVGGRLQKVEVNNRVLDETLFVRAGWVRLEQILINLVRNSLEAMHESGVKRLELAAEPAPGPDGAEGIAITVRDTGTGIAGDVFDKMFQPFFSTKEQTEGGLGLGLSISYGIVESFGGTLSAANHPDGGAVFTLWLLREADGGHAAPPALLSRTPSHA